MAAGARLRKSDRSSVKRKSIFRPSRVCPRGLAILIFLAIANNLLRPVLLLKKNPLARLHFTGGPVR